MVTYPGVPMGYMEGWEDQTIEHCFFLDELVAPTSYRQTQGALKLGDVDQVVFSEVLSDMTAIAAKGE